MILIDDQHIFAASRPLALIDVLATAFRGASTVPARMHCELPGEDHSLLLIMPAWREREALGVKLATVIPSNPAAGRATINGVYLLFHPVSGEPKAVLSARALTLLRTAAVSALASRELSRPDSHHLLMLGTGALSPHLIRAHCAVRPITRVSIWGRSPAKAMAVSEQLTDLAVVIEVVENLVSTTRQADIVSCATLSNDPLIEGENLAKGSHVDLVGSFSPGTREADDRLFERAILVVDTPTAFEESGDLIGPLSRGIILPNALTLGDLLRDPTPIRRNASEITVFKSVGTGLADLAAAEHFWGHITNGQNQTAAFADA